MNDLCGQSPAPLQALRQRLGVDISIKEAGCEIVARTSGIDHLGYLCGRGGSKPVATAHTGTGLAQLHDGRPSHPGQVAGSLNAFLARKSQGFLLVGKDDVNIVVDQPAEEVQVGCYDIVTG